MRCIHVGLQMLKGTPSMMLRSSPNGQQRKYQELEVQATVVARPTPFSNQWQLRRFSKTHSISSSCSKNPTELVHRHFELFVEPFSQTHPYFSKH